MLPTAIRAARSLWTPPQLTLVKTRSESTAQVASAVTFSSARRKFPAATSMSGRTCKCHRCVYLSRSEYVDFDAICRKASKALTDSHVSFITMTDSSQAANKHLRIGGQSKILMYNRETDDATLPDLSPQGIASSAALPTNKWTCFEYHLGTDGTVETWLNNATVAGLTVKSGVSNPNAAQWQRSSSKPKITGVYFGWESYGGDTNTFWYDDIVVSKTRVGC
jgi:hypothetical protein